jgi:hypothetical protein
MLLYCIDVVAVAVIDIVVAGSTAGISYSIA